MKPFNRPIVYTVAITVALVAAIQAVKVYGQGPQGHGAGHAQFHDFYRDWKMPGSDASCCNVKRTVDGHTTGDCYPTEARFTQGHWMARRDTGEWIDVPEEKIIREKNPDSSGQDAHLCESYGHVFCFVPPTGGT